MEIEQVRQAFKDAIGKPLQPGLRRLGVPNEKQATGPLFSAILDALLPEFRPDKGAPTQLTVEPIVILTEEQCRQLERELGRILCDSGDVLFGTIQIVRQDEEEPPWDYTPSIDFRDIRSTTGGKVDAL